MERTIELRLGRSDRMRRRWNRVVHRRAGAPSGDGPGLGIVGRSVLVTCAVALVSVLVTALVAVPLAQSAALKQERRNLANQADLCSALLSPDAGHPKQQARLAQRLTGFGVQVSLVVDGRPARPWVPPDVAGKVASGQPVSILTRRSGGRQWVVEGRPLATGNGVVLAQPVGLAWSSGVLPRVLLALLAGLVAGVVAGLLLARRMVRPIRRAAAAARRIGAGERTVRLPEEPPQEVAELSRALNGMAGALAESEDRQRDFLLSVSHELRTPLTTIRGYAEAMHDGVLAADPDAVRQAGTTVLAESARLDRLISDLLALARLSAQDFPLEVLEVDLVELTRAALTAWRPRCAEAGVRLGGELPAHPVPVRTDPGRLRQVLDGLMENALRILPTGAPLVLAVDAVPQGGRVTVRDGGPGLTDDDLAVAFQRGMLYQRYRGVRRVGSGLGLALAARLVTRLGGRIEAGHAPEGGASFAVTLPAR